MVMGICCTIFVSLNSKRRRERRTGRWKKRLCCYRCYFSVVAVLLSADVLVVVTVVKVTVMFAFSMIVVGAGDGVEEAVQVGDGDP